MTITTTLTPRDKKLLVFLAVFLLVAGVGWFVLKPAAEELAALDRKVAEAEMVQRYEENSASSLAEYQKLWEEKAALLREKAQALTPYTQAQDIDRLLTTQALRYGLEESNLRELHIQMPQGELTLPLYQTEQTDSETAPADAASEEKQTLAGISAAQVRFVLYGERVQLEGFCDRLLQQEPALRVCTFFWQEDAAVPGKYTLTLELELYMTDAEQITAEAPAEKQA